MHFYILKFNHLNELGNENEKTHQHIDGFLSVAGNLEKSNEFLDDYYRIVAFATITE